MKISNKKKEKVYEVVRNKLVDLRIEISRNNLTRKEIDNRLSDIEAPLYEQIIMELEGRK